MQTQNEEMIGVLTAMSIVAERLAKQLQKIEEENKDENDNGCEENAKSNVATGRR